ncbi:heat shock factor 2-binding protein [Nannospalax galili]|nr:heat shock factor 2-binding protein [Nannospalax galili]
MTSRERRSQSVPGARVVGVPEPVGAEPPERVKWEDADGCVDETCLDSSMRTAGCVDGVQSLEHGRRLRSPDSILKRLSPLVLLHTKLAGGGDKAQSGAVAEAMGEAGRVAEQNGHMGLKEEFVKVRKKDLERLTTEVMQIRDFLPRILNGEVLESFQKLKIVEKNLERKEQELEQLKLDCEHFKSRLETMQADSGREKKEKLALRQQLNEAKQQLLQQAEYCTQLGAATCTLLWGVSSSEEVVKAILGGDKALKFFNITGQTMESFVKSLDGDVEVDSDENQFVFALAGIVTNVAAIACGREFLVNSSRVLLDTMLQLLGDLKPGQCTKLKVLMLMSLYNVSINSKGLKYISESPGFIPLLWWLLSDPDAEVCLHVLRLIQSVILEPEVFSKSASELLSSLPLQRIVVMSKSRNPHLKTAAQELLEDLNALERSM